MEFRVNTYTTGAQGEPVVAVDARGSFVAIWSSVGQDGSASGVFGQRFAAAGTPLGGEFRVNTTTVGDQVVPAVGSIAGGGFVVVWESRGGHDGSGSGIFGQRFDNAGDALGTEFQVNAYTTGYQVVPSVATDSAGGFVVVWEDRSHRDGDVSGVFGQRFTPAGSDFLVNSHTTSNQMLPAVAIVDGGFVVTWESWGQDGPNSSVFAQRYTAAGARIGAEFRVNTSGPGEQREPCVASAGGGFVVAWQSYPGDGSGWGAFGRRFTGSGAPLGGDFRVNSYTTGYQWSPGVASDPNGNFTVAWQSAGGDGNGAGVAAQRFGGLLPAALDVDTGGNSVLEPGESVDVRPSWRNVNGAAQTFSAALSSFGGPAGAAYAITDGTGGYGTVPDGVTAPCTDCYGVSVSDPATRPALHWDATAMERITPDTQGQQKTWALHLGRSFIDVPATSGFYHFIETLLHHAVTGGCGTDTYCPAASTSREQMAVFVLVAKEGTGYSPPACTTPVFDDVPASSPFCRFIEELARRAVVSGCGGANYCPQDPVTREQMAVFVLRTLDPALDPPACATPIFGDVPASSPFCRWIEELARRDVVTGCGGGNYCPAQPVTREQMGVFVAVAFGLMLYGP